MKRSTTRPRASTGQRCMAALVLGTALSTLGSASAAPGQPTEAVLRAVSDMNRYCTVCWRNARLHPDCWTDCTQEVFCRLMARVQPGSWSQVLADDGEERREFIRAIDAVKKRTQRSRKYLSRPLDTVADPRDLREQQLTEDRETVRRAAGTLLSPRQQRILDLSFEGWSVQEIARELRVPPERVSDEKYKAVHKLRDHFGSTPAA